MTKTYQITFEDYEEFPSSRDAFSTSFDYSIIEKDYINTAEEDFQTRHYKIIIEVTRTLARVWELNSNVNKEDLTKVMFEYARKHIKQKIIDDSLSEYEILTLYTYNTENPKCRFNPSKINEPIGFTEDIEQEQAQILMADRGEIEIASRIIGMRDNINAVFSEQHNEKLFLLRNERCLLELLRPAISHEEFVYRLSGLSTLIDDVNLELLRSITKESDKNKKSIGLIGEYIKNSGIENKERVSEILRNINRLRQGYPTHTDGASGFLNAHQFFGLSYPITDYNLAWKKILLGYDESLSILLDIVREKRQD